MDRAQKRELVAALHGVFQNTSVIVVAHYAGLSVADMNGLRGEMRNAGASLRVAKNRLVRIALEGTPPAGMADLFTGPTVIAYSDDPVAAPKVAVEYARRNDHFVVLGGAMGATVLDTDGVRSLASLPSLDELRARIAGMVTRPAARIARLVNEPGAQLARVINAYATKTEAA